LSARQKLKPIEALLAGICFLVALAYFVRVGANPSGFFIDEASIAYNAHAIAQTGADEYGQTFPLYFRAFGEYKSPLYIYLLAALFRLTGPSIFVARFLSAVFGFLTIAILALLAARISKQRLIGLIVFSFAGLTPWLFEVSRLVFEVTLLPALLALFLLTLYEASKQETWSIRYSIALAVLLGLMVYSYSGGRLLAPLFALGLVFFVTRSRWRAVVITWLLFALTLLPLVVFSARHPGTLGERFKYVTYVKNGDTQTQIVLRFLKNYLWDFSPRAWLLLGDPEPRHHLPGMGSLLIGVVACAIIGLVCVVLYRRREAWWRFMIYGLVVSPIPAALTLDHFHTLRLIAMPLFLIVLSVPALAFLLEKPSIHSVRMQRLVLTALVILTLAQGAWFQWRFQTSPQRVDAFDSYYPNVLDAALAQPERPIYLFDKTPAAYMYAYWYATLRGLDLHNFQRVTIQPAAGSVVISHELPCTNCEMIFERGQFRVYRVR